MPFSIVSSHPDEGENPEKILFNLNKVESIGEFEGFTLVCFKSGSFKIKESIQQVIDNVVSFK